MNEFREIKPYVHYSHYPLHLLISSHIIYQVDVQVQLENADNARFCHGLDLGRLASRAWATNQFPKADLNLPPLSNTMVVLSDLPAELLLNVLKDLSLRDLGALSRTSHALNETIKANAETIYRTAAVLHRFARPTGLLEDIAWQVYPPGRDVRCSWRDFCEL